MVSSVPLKAERARFIQRLCPSTKQAERSDPFGAVLNSWGSQQFVGIRNMVSECSAGRISKLESVGLHLMQLPIRGGSVASTCKPAQRTRSACAYATSDSACGLHANSFQSFLSSSTVLASLHVPSYGDVILSMRCLRPSNRMLRIRMACNSARLRYRHCS